MAAKILTAVHITHEAVRKIGGIGTVLEGLVTAPAYRREIKRTILVGPLFEPPPGRGGACDARSALGPGSRLLYSSLDRVDEGNFEARLGPIRKRFGTGIVYGKRLLQNQWNEESAEVEILLVDIANMYRAPVDEFKGQLHEKFDLHSDRYEYIWDYEQYVRLALPAFAAIERLVNLSGENQVVVIAHEYMGVPTALRALLANSGRISSVFHAHEVATVRRIVEEHPAHDTMFYNLMPRARSEGLFLNDLFGNQDSFFKHGLVAAAHNCDSVFAVGEFVRQELQLLAEPFSRREIDLVPNGLPAVRITRQEQQNSRRLLCDYAETLLGWRPSFVFSHVARLVMSKAFWRDIHVLRHLDRSFAEAGQTAVFFLLGTEGAQRSTEEVLRMESDYGWPWNHRIGYPDLTGPEIGLDNFLQDFNRRSRAIKAVLVNQFGWEPARCGKRIPRDMTFADLRKGTDVEFGQSIYEPFGVSQLEALTFGALCLPTNVCGCVSFAAEQSSGNLPGNILVADYVSAAGGAGSARSLMEMSQQQADHVLNALSHKIAQKVLLALIELARERDKHIREGYELASRMSWDVIAENFFVPALRRSLKRAEARSRIPAYGP